MLSKKLFFFICLFASVGLFAQDPIDEEEMTESSVPTEYKYLDNVVPTTVFDEAPFLEYDHLRENDVVWSKRLWRVIDVREKINMAFRSPHKPFFTILREMAENGDVAVFNDEFFKDPLTIDQIDKKLNRIDTTTIFDYDTYEEKVTVVKNEVNWEDIKKFRVKEMWYFDKEASVFQCRILGISPMLDEIDPDTGEIKYTLPLFWIYYPEAREFLAKYRVENDDNEISPMSWYDLFEQRKFASYLMKRSNTLDLRIEDKYHGYDRAGIDKLMESEKIKAELFNFEHDLWEY